MASPELYFPASVVPVRPDPYPNRIPVHLGEWGHNAAFWYRVGLLGFLWRLRPEVQKRVTTVKAALGYKRPIMALHVRHEIATTWLAESYITFAAPWRHGDACSGREVGGERACYGLEAYMGPAREFRKRYGINRIYLATDDEASVEWARQNPHGFEWVVPQMDRSRYALLCLSRIFAPHCT